MKNILLVTIFVVISLTTRAQYWETVEGGTHGSYEGEGPQVYAILADSVHHLLNVAGTFYSAGDLQSRNLAFWDGLKWISSEAQIGYGGYGTPVTTLGFYKDTLFDAGSTGIGCWLDTSLVLTLGPNLRGVNGFCLSQYFIRYHRCRSVSIHQNIVGLDRDP